MARQYVDSPLFAMVPDMEAVIAMLPLILRLIISLATAWIERKVPAHVNTVPLIVLTHQLH
jgi:hypothetical protein